MMQKFLEALERSVWARIGLLALFIFSSNLDLALADCSSIAKQTHEDDLRTATALTEYLDVAVAISKIPSQTEKIEKGLSANAKATDAIRRQTASLEKAKIENCFGQKSADWEAILTALKIKLAELDRERELITKVGKASQQVNPTRANWQTFLNPSLKAFSACLDLKHFQYSASKKPRISPADFSLIIRGACKDEEVQLETEQNKIEGWTPEDKQGLKSAIVSTREKVISEYAEAFHKAN
jgi:hypothetical protein